MERATILIESRGQWLDMRRLDLTASVIGAVFGCHPYLSSEQLIGIKRGTFDQGDTASMRRGRILEPAVAAALSEDHPLWKIEKATTYHRLPERRIGATPDYWMTDENGVEGLIQIKTVNPEIWEKWAGRVPLYFQLQTLVELMCTDRARGLLAIMVISRSLPVHEYTVPRHAGAEAKILAAAARWWADFDSGTPHEVTDPHEIAADLDDGSHRDLSDNNYLREALPRWQHLKGEISAASHEVADIETAIRKAMGSASSAWLPGWSLSYRQHRRREYTVAAKDIRTLRVSATEEETANGP